MQYTNYPTQHKLNTADKKPVQYIAKILLINDLDEDEQPNQAAPERKECLTCDSLEHDLFHCEKFLDEEIPKRYEMVKELKICFRCLKGHHFGYRCGSKQRCGLDGCKVFHHKIAV